MKNFFLYFIVVCTHANKMLEKGTKDKESKYLLVKIKDRSSNKNETDTIIDGKI